MAHRLSPDARLFWVWALPSYVAGAYTLLRIVRMVREEIWCRRVVRRQSLHLVI
jgi:hypothetical protein